MAGARLSFEERKAVCIHLCIQSVYEVCIHFLGPLCLLCLLLYLQIFVSFERAFCRRCAEGCEIQTHGFQPSAEWCITLPSSRGIDSPHGGRWRNKLIVYIHQFQCNVFITVFHSVQVFRLLEEMTLHVKDVRKISSAKEEIICLKKAVNDTVNYLESNQSLVSHWFSTVSVWCLICKRTVQADALLSN